jgi:uncharacterized protein YoxC
MDIVIGIAQVVALVALAALCVALIRTLGGLKTTLEVIARELPITLKSLNEVQGQLKQTLGRLEEVAVSTDSMLESLERQVVKSEAFTDALVRTGQRVESIVTTVETSIVDPVRDTVAAISRTRSMVSTFLGVFKKEIHSRR